MEVLLTFLFFFTRLLFVEPLTKVKVNKTDYLMFRSTHSFRFITFDNGSVINVNMDKSGQPSHCTIADFQLSLEKWTKMVNMHQRTAKNHLDLKKLFGNNYRR